MNKNINPYNNNKQPHSYWEQYYSNGKLAFKCVFINGKKNGIAEWYNIDEKVFEKTYYL